MYTKFLAAIDSMVSWVLTGDGLSGALPVSQFSRTEPSMPAGAITENLESRIMLSANPSVLGVWPDIAEDGQASVYVKFDQPIDPDSFSMSDFMLLQEGSSPVTELGEFHPSWVWSIDDESLYHIDGHGMTIYDISDPSDIEVVAWDVDLPPVMLPVSMVVRNDMVYMFGGDNVFRILDVSGDFSWDDDGPDEITVLGSLPVPMAEWPYIESFQLVDNYVYFSCQTQLYCIDVCNTTSPSFVGVYDFSDSIESCYVVDSLAYVECGGDIYILDIANGDDAEVLNVVAFDGSLVGVADAIAYVLESDELVAYDTRSLYWWDEWMYEESHIVGVYEFDDLSSERCLSLAFPFMYALEADGLQIIDVRDASQMQLVTQLDIEIIPDDWIRSVQDSVIWSGFWGVELYHLGYAVADIVDVGDNTYRIILDGELSDGDYRGIIYPNISNFDGLKIDTNCDGNAGEAADAIEFSFTVGDDAAASITDVWPPSVTDESIEDIYISFDTEIDASLLQLEDFKLVLPAGVALESQGILGLYGYTLTFDRNYVYVSYDSSARMFDISDPTNPVFTASLPPISDIVLYDHYLYANWNGSLCQIDISDPADIVVVTDILGDVDDIYLEGDWAYIEQDEDMVILDVSDPANLTQVGFYEDIGDLLVVQDGYAFAYSCRGVRYDISYGIDIIDISRRLDPVVIGRYIIPESYSLAISNLQYHQGHLYFTTYDEDAGSDVLAIVDITTPSAPVQVAGYCLPDNDPIDEVLVCGSVAYVSSGYMLYMLDISNPAKPILAGQYEPELHYISNLWMSAGRLYINSGGGVEIFNTPHVFAESITQLDSHLLKFTFPVSSVAGGYQLFINDEAFATQFTTPVSFEGAGSLEYKDGYLVASVTVDYAADAPQVVAVSPSDDIRGQVEYIDITFDDEMDLNSLAAHSLWIIPDRHATATKTTVDVDFGDLLAVQGNLLYSIWDYGSHCSLGIFDISDFNNITCLGGCDYIAGPESIWVRGSYAYIATDDGDIFIIDVSDKASPFVAGVYESDDIAIDIDVQGSLLYVADDTNQLKVVNISDPSNPYLDYTLSAPNDITAVAVENSFLFVGLRGNLQIYANASLSQPTLLAEVPVVCVPGEISFYKSRIYVSPYGRAGLSVVIDVSDWLGIDYSRNWAPDAILGDLAVDYAWNGDGASFYFLDGEDGRIEISGYSIDDVSYSAFDGIFAYYQSSAFDGGTFVTTGAVVESVSDIGGNTYRFYLQQPLAAGQYQCVLNSNVQNTSGVALNSDGDYYPGENNDIFAFAFEVQDDGAAVVEITPEEVEDQSPSYVDVQFDEAVDDSSLSVYDIIVTEYGNTHFTAIDSIIASATAFSYCDDRLYVADGDSGFVIYDISDPQNISVLGTYQPAHGIMDFDIDGEVAYLALADNSVHIVDISDPGDCQLELAADGLGAAKLQYKAGLLYIVFPGSEFVSVKDVRESTQTINTFYGFGVIQDFQIVGSSLYVISRDASSGAGRLFVCDISTPSFLDTETYVIGSYYGLVDPRALCVSDSLIYVADGVGGMKVLMLPDSDTAVSLELVASISAVSCAEDIAVVGSLALVSDSTTGLHAFNLLHPNGAILEQPVYAGCWSAAGITRIEACGSVVCCIDGSGDIQILHIGAEIDSLTKLDDATYRFGLGESLSMGAYDCIVGPYITNMDGYYLDQNDNGRSAEPADAGRLYMGVVLPGPQVVETDPLVYHGDGLDYIDITFDTELDPNTISSSDLVITQDGLPVIYNELTAVQLDAYNDVCINGDRMYVCNAGEGTWLYDISDIANPVLMTHYTDMYLFQIKIVSGVAYGHDGHNFYRYNIDGDGYLSFLDSTTAYSSGHTPYYEFEVVDGMIYAVSEDCFGAVDTSFMDVFTMSLPYGAGGIEIYQDYAYVPGYAGLMVVDVADITNLSVLSYCLEDSLDEIKVVGDRLLAVGDEYFKIFDLADPLSPALLGSCLVSESGGYGEIQIKGRYAYINYWDHIVLVDITNRYNPVLAGQIDTWGGYDCVIDGSELYVTESASNTLHVLQQWQGIGYVTYLGDNAYRFVFSSPLLPGEYQCELGPEIASIHGAYMNLDGDYVYHEPDDVYGFGVSVVDTPLILGTYVIYNNSQYDGFDSAANISDDAAIAVNKEFYDATGDIEAANYTSYSRGINGIMLDVVCWEDYYDLDSYGLGIFTLWYEPFADVPEPLSITVRPGDGVGASDRVTILWADKAIANQWLVMQTNDTPDLQQTVVLIGNLPADANGDRIVDLDDFIILKQNYGRNDGVAMEQGDFNCDGRVDLDDFIALKQNYGSTLNSLDWTPPADTVDALSSSVNIAYIQTREEAVAVGIKSASPGLLLLGDLGRQDAIITDLLPVPQWCPDPIIKVV